MVNFEVFRFQPIQSTEVVAFDNLLGTQKIRMKTSTLESNDLIAPELTHMDLHGVCDGLQRAVARTVLVH